MKRSMHEAVCAELGVRPERASYLDDTGHMSGVDSLLGLDRAVARRPRLATATPCCSSPRARATRGRRASCAGAGMKAADRRDAGRSPTWSLVVNAPTDAARHAPLASRPLPATAHGRRLRGRAGLVRRARPQGEPDRERARSSSASQKGDKVATVLDNCVEMIELYHAAARTGLVVVPLSPLLRGSGLTNLVNDSDARALVTNAALAPELDRVRAELEGVPADRFILVDGAAPGYHSYRELARGGERAADRLRDDRPRRSLQHHLLVGNDRACRRESSTRTRSARRTAPASRRATGSTRRASSSTPARSSSTGRS